MSRPVVYSYPPAPQDWVAIQDVIKDLYVDQKLRLKEVRAVLHRRHGFRASERMVKARLKQWGYLKNAKKEDWHLLALLHQRRKEQGLPAQVFDVRGHRKTVRDLHRFIRNQSQGYEQFLQEARTSVGNQPIPAYITVVNPNEVRSDSISTSEGSPDLLDLETVRSTRPKQAVEDLSHSQYLLPPTDLHRRVSTTYPSVHDYSHRPNRSWLGNPSDQQMHDPAFFAGADTINCQQVQWEMETMPSQLVHPTSLISRIGEPDIRSWTMINPRPTSSNGSDSEMSCEYICSRCSQPSNQHFISLDSFEPLSAKQRKILNDSDETLHLPVSTKEEGPWTWLSRCFMACMLMSKGQEEGAQLSLIEAGKEFERLLDREDSLLLTAAGQLVVILHQHDQGAIARRVMETANEVALRKLPNHHPVRLTIEYLTASTDLSYENSDITSDTLRGVVLDFSQRYPPDHEYLIAARYNYAFLLKREAAIQQDLDKRNAAETEFTQVLSLSKRILGDGHMQTIAIQGSLAGLFALETARKQEAIDLLQIVDEQSSQLLGPNHPYPCEARRRIANLLLDMNGYNETVLRLYKDVLWGRVRMLGASHKFTEGAKVDYEIALKALHLWEDAHGDPTFEQHELQLLLEPGSPDSWTKLVKRRKSTMESGGNRPNLSDEFSEHDMDDEDDDDFEQVQGSASPASSNEYEAY